jgi:arylsulfatase A-like enzyme
MRGRGTVRGLVAAVLLAVAAGCASPLPFGRPGYKCPDCNVILISIDTLRADHLSAYGHFRPTSPHIDRMAADGVLFESFFHNGGGTLPSHMTMLTSLHPLNHLVLAGNRRTLEDGRITLAEQLKARGFATAGFVDAGWMKGKFGFTQGFDVYDDAGGQFAKIMPKVNAWLDENRQRRFFLFVHTYDVHSAWHRLPYDCPGDFPTRYTAALASFDGCRGGRCASRLLAWVNSRIKTGRLTAATAFQPAEIDFMRALYDGCINYADEQVGALLVRLKELGLYDRSLIVLTSDHGEEFAEHGLFLHPQNGYEEVAHIPLILKLPRGEERGRRVGHLAAMVDVMPTILDIVDVPLNPQAQGKSLMPAVLDDARVRTMVHVFGRSVALRTETWKYFSDHLALYDLLRDPRELANVVGDQGDVSEQLERDTRALVGGDTALHDAFEREAAGGNTPAVLTDEEVRNLKALGYL